MDTRQYNELKSLLLQLDEKVSNLVAEKEKELLSPKEVQDMLCIGKTTYQRYLRDEVITQTKIRGKAYVQRSEIERLIKEGKI